MSRIYHDEDASLEALEGRTVAVIGYGNQGRSQAMNLRDSGVAVIVGNRGDESLARAREEGFEAMPVAEAAARACLVMVLVPDEVQPELYQSEIAPGLTEGDCLSFASGYNIAFGLIEPADSIDVIMVAPRMIGPGVRDRFLEARGFPSFVGVHQDASGRAAATMLALARGIGSTKAGCLEMTMAEEAHLDLFTEQGFGPAMGLALRQSIEFLVEEGYPPEAVLMEIYMSGELAYTAERFVDMGIIDQMDFHSHTSQYGSMTRAARLLDIDLKPRLREALDDIRSGRFADEWTKEQEAGQPTFKAMKQLAKEQPLYEWERRTRRAFSMD